MRTSSGREAKPCTEPGKCRSCGAEVLWAMWPASGKKMPVDYPHDSRGGLILTLRGGEFGELLLEKFDGARHDSKRNRYTSHFETCPQAGEHRRSS